jgi:RimJ/RimL family protein N-acetyltransferase
LEPEITLRRATLADLDAIMGIERRPGYRELVGRSTRAEHVAMLASPRFTYFLGVSGEGAVLAFAILRDHDDPHGNLYLKRIAAERPGAGIGVAFSTLLLDWVFRETKTHRFHLDCFAHNARARALYDKLGFTRDGVLREAYLAPDGSRRDLVLMALTRPEWEASRRSVARVVDS